MTRNRSMPGIPIDRITPDVEAIDGEHGRFLVQSRSGTERYMVDLFENGFVGKCNCAHFEFRIQPDIDRGINVNGNQFCYHIKRAERCFIETMKRALWATGNRPKTKRPMGWSEREWQLEQSK